MCELNTASVETLAELPGVNTKLAYSIQLWRPYFDWADVAQVPGLDWEMIDGFRVAGAELVAPPPSRLSSTSL